MIQKRRDDRIPNQRPRSNENFKNMPGRRRFSDDRAERRRPFPARADAQRVVQQRAPRQQQNLRRAALAAPKREKTIRLGENGKKARFIKQKILKPSEVRLKVRNLDEKQVTNDDLKKLF
jgi:hypothetical protein